MRAVEVSMFPELRSHKAVGPLPASVVTGTNADLIVEIKDLYLTGTVLDVTYGKGSWWTRWRPTGLVGHDLKTDGVDFTNLPYADRSWSTVCYDPPYIPTGGKDTTTAGAFQERFGLNHGRSQDALDALVYAGLVARARSIGLHLHDEIIHHAGSGPGGHNIVTPKRARRHHSKLLVFTWDRR